MATKYIIEIDDDDRGPEDYGRPWNAALFEQLEYGKTGDVIGVGIGATPREALTDLVNSGDFIWDGGDEK